MKIENESVELVSSGVENEESFSIGNLGMILDILRSKLYSNIKLAICREYSCNARDAHREAGKPELPIVITLPTWVNPNWSCRDFGPGISPDRVATVFVRYGVSTKRDSNDQVGAFGIGAKSAFGYSATFTVNTFIDGTKRSYAAVMDDSKCGKFMLLSTTPTTEENGTEIVVPVKSQDFYEFVKETTNVTQHWPVKPVIHGGSITYNEFPALLEGTNWKAAKTQNGSRGYKAIVDGIEYPVPPTLGSYLFSYGTETFLYFKTGEVSISANRELLELNEKTEKAIQQRIAVVEKELEQNFLDAVASATSFLEANVRLGQIAGTLGLDVPDGIEWNNKKLFGHYTRLDSSTMLTYGRAIDGSASKTSKNPSSQLNFAMDTVYCLTTRDFDKVTESGATSVLRAHPGKTKVCMIRCNDTTEFAKKNLDSLDLVKVENFYTPKSRKASLGRLTFYKMNGGGDFSRTSLKDYEENTNKKAWCHIRKAQGYNVKENRACISPKIGDMDSANFGRMIAAALPGYSIYGFSTDLAPEKIEEATEEMENVEKLLNDFVEQNNIDLREVLHKNYLSDGSLNAATLLFSQELEEVVNNASKFKGGTDHEFVKFCKKGIELSRKADFYKNLVGLLQVVQEEKRSPKDFTTISRMEGALLLVKYPLLKHFVYTESAHGYSRRPTSIPTTEMIDYINVCDKANG